MPLGWKKGKLFEWGVVGWGQELMGTTQHKVLFLLPG